MTEKTTPPTPSSPPAPEPDAFTRALLANPQFMLVPRSGKGFVIGGQNPAQGKR
jgi:hypothetical protein